MKKNTENITNSLKNKHKSIIVLLSVLFLGLLVYLGIQHQTIQHIKKTIWGPEGPQSCLTVFVHGNFNTGLGFLSFADVFKDNLKGSIYKKVIKKIRKDTFFFQEQPILEKGLVKVEPSFDIEKIKNRYGVHPILSSYKTILDHLYPNQEKTLFYTFGWNGLMSQSGRRKAALRFHNSLTEELERLQKEGIKPKVRIIAHSHGGNVSINLALINDILNNVSYEGKCQDAENYFQDMQKLIKSLPEKEMAKKQQSQKRFHYKPTKNIFVDELIILGTPIQDETSHCLNSPTFKKLFSLYSDEDVVQSMDFVSTKKYSSQRVDHFERGNNNFMQAKVMVDKDVKQNITASPWWKRIFFGTMFPSSSKDPTHKDLWFLAWNPDFCQPNFPLNPLPLVILTPLLSQALAKANHWDADINLRFSKHKVEVCILKHNTSEPLYSTHISTKVIETLKTQTQQWKPENITREETFKKIIAQL